MVIGGMLDWLGVFRVFIYCGRFFVFKVVFYDLFVSNSGRWNKD